MITEDERNWKKIGRKIGRKNREKKTRDEINDEKNKKVVDWGSSVIERSRKGKETQRVKRRGSERSR